ncbi:MAG: hypothetical protein ACYSVY_22290 [Planctomycetota bacterium]|jgi:hypothetical protein
MARIYKTALAAAEAYAGPRAMARVTDRDRYLRRLIRRGVLRAATPDEYRARGWSHGWVLTQPTYNRRQR